MLSAQTLFDASACYLCYGLSQSEAMQIALLNNIAGNSGSSSGAAWGGITGTLSNQTDLQAALDTKTDHYVLTLFNSAFGGFMNSSTTYFLGQVGSGSAPFQTTYVNVRAIVPITGTVVAVSIMAIAETNSSSAQLMTINLNKNNGTLQALAPGFNLVGPQSPLYTGLNFPVAAGDFLALQLDTPVWSLSPQTTRMTCNVLIKKT